MSDFFDVENAMARGYHNQKIDPPTLVYHDSAHSIVFRDHLRRQSSYSQQPLDRKHGRSLSIGSSHSGRNLDETEKGDETPSDTGSVSSGGTGTWTDNNGAIQLRSNDHGSSPIIIITANVAPHIEPLEPLPLTATDEFQPVLSSNAQEESKSHLLSSAERNVVTRLQKEQCVVKTIRNQDWSEFLQRFKKVNSDSILSMDNLPYNTFKTSTSLLPSGGFKMRCYGSSREYSHGVIFALPESNQTISDTDRSDPWCWPSGYSAKTEFNIDDNGNLINGRNEALVTLEKLRKMNHSFINDTDYEIAGKLVKGGLNTVPYNEVYVRVGGFGREIDTSTVECIDTDQHAINRSFSRGLGIPIAMFARSAMYKDLIGLLRLRSRMGAVLGKMSILSIPLLVITPESGAKVLTDKLQTDLLRIMSSELNPFQNPLLQNKTSINNTSEEHLQEKRDELFNLDDENIRSVLTAEECARLAGGFGATDESVAHLLMNAMLLDSSNQKHQSSITDDFIKRNRLQDLVNEGLCAAVRSGDYNTARQLLILYSLVASTGETGKGNSNHSMDDICSSQQACTTDRNLSSSGPLLSLPTMVNSNCHSFPSDSLTLATLLPLPPPPPPLDTDRLRFATNSDGLLAVLGAAEILRSIRDGMIKRRAEEVVQALEEWLEKSDSITFRLQSWRNQKAAQGERKIATQQESNLMAFISSKAINNRKLFIDQLRTAIDAADFQSISFLKSLHSLVTGLHSPCLRLELLQYILNLDNRFSIAHIGRSLELSATCLSISLRDSCSVELYSDDKRENASKE